MKKATDILRLSLSMFLSLSLCLSGGITQVRAAETRPDDTATDVLYGRFQTPPRESKSRPLWFWNSAGRRLSDITKEGIREIMVGSSEQSGYFGFGILPNWLDNYLSDDYLELYGYALAVAKELGMKMCLYDEDGFPSGTAGGLLARDFPESTLKRLDKSETDVAGPAPVTLAIPQGAYRTYLGAVAVNTDTHEILDISDRAVFADEPAVGVSASTSHAALGGETFGPDRAFDGDYGTRWNAGSSIGVDQWLETHYETDTTVDRVVIREALGRIRSYAVQYYDGNGWVDLAAGSTLGALREHSFPAVTARRFRLMIYTTSAPTDSASIYEVEWFHDGVKLPTPAVGDNFDRVVWEAPAGTWKVMAFASVKDGDGLVDYLSGEAVDNFIATTHEVYYEHFSEYFGDVIDSAFYDEPMLYHAQGRTWTGRFNELFEAAYGYNPITLYPALWYDIGGATASARNALFGFRTELFATQYIKRLNDWCRAHGIALTGHMDQEENVNPTTSPGDMLKIFSHQDIPGVDEVFAYDRALKAYKLVSSSAYNWDKGLVMTETYGGMGENMGIPVLYKDIMNQLVRGINFVVPHAIWYNNERAIDNPPELSFRSARYGPELPAYNDFIGRVSGLLQNGRHVADIGVVYPIHTLQAATQFDVGNPYYGVAPEEADYMDLGHMLSTTLRRDFTYLHPEIIAERCEADGDTFRLQNDVNYENYKVLIMPGAKTISLAALEKIQDFFEGGGQVIATTQLPYQSAESGRDGEVREIISEMFGVEASALLPSTALQYTASSFFQNNPQYAPEKAFDGEASNGSRWNAGDQSGGNQWLQVDFGRDVTVSRAVIQENPPYRVTAYRVQAWDGAGWTDCASGTSIGASAAVDFTPVTTDRVRLYIDAIVSDSVSIQEFALYHGGGNNLARPEELLAEQENEAGGRAVFLGRAYTDTLADTLDRLLPVFDVKVTGVPGALPGGSFSYLHKVKDGHEIYYFANSGDTALSGTVDLRGRLSAPMLWNPHDGTRTAAACEILTVDGIPVTRVTLSLDKVSSVFIVARPAGEMIVSVHPDKTARTVTVAGSGFSPHQRVALLAAYQRTPSASDCDYAAEIFADEAGDVRVTLPAEATQDLPWLGGHRYEASLDGVAASAPIFATTVKAHSSARVSLRIKGRAPLNFSIDSAVYEFASSNPDVVSVDQNGLVTGRKAGTTLVTLRALDGSGLMHVVTVSVG